METNDSPVCECDSPEPYHPPVRQHEVGDVLINPEANKMTVVTAITHGSLILTLICLNNTKFPATVEMEQSPAAFNTEADTLIHEHGWKYLTVPLVGDRIIFYQDLAIVTVTGYHHNEGSPTVEWTMHDKEGKLPIIGSLEDWKASFARQMSTGGTFEPVPRPREACNMEAYAQRELEILKAKHGTDGLTVGTFIPEILALVSAFGRSGQSGGSSPFAAGNAVFILKQLLQLKPLSPLTGADDEWIDQSGLSGRPMLQNNRLGTVFKSDGAAWYSDAIWWFEDRDHPFSGPVNGTSSRQRILEFPYEPETLMVEVERIPGKDPDDYEYRIVKPGDIEHINAKWGHSIEFIPPPARPAKDPA